MIFYGKKSILFGSCPNKHCNSGLSLCSYDYFPTVKGFGQVPKYCLIIYVIIVYNCVHMLGSPPSQFLVARAVGFPILVIFYSWEGGQSLLSMEKRCEDFAEIFVAKDLQ